MNLKKKIAALENFGKELTDAHIELEKILQKTELENGWFTQNYMHLSLDVFRNNYFHAEKLEVWAAQYKQKENNAKKIALVLAGNIPFVGMHDLLCVLMSGNHALIKLSSKDKYFFPFMLQKLTVLYDGFSGSVEFVDRLEKFDAVIATGSNNSARYFKYYFEKYPHIIRRNRTSVAILTGNETDEQLHELGKDVFYYYGLGCRNVSKVFVPAGFDMTKLFGIWEDFQYTIENTKYKNNFDYNRAVLLLNQTPHLANDFFMMLETEKLHSPLSVLHYEMYHSQKDLEEKLQVIQDELQCVVAAAEGNTPFGKTQFPTLTDYADHIDTMQWLCNL